MHNRNENTPALLQNIAVAIASAAAAAEGSSSSRRNRRAGKVVGGLRGDLWSANPAVVLLADKDKVEMDAAVQEVVRWGVMWVCDACGVRRGEGRRVFPCVLGQG